MSVTVSPSTDTRLRQPVWLLSTGLLVALCAVSKLIIHLYANQHYGYFSDELYYLDCARHLAWGYVDQPPLVAFAAWMERAILGDSLAAIRFLPALAGVAKILLTGLIARDLGGGRFAQGLAALSVLAAPGFLGIDNLLSMNPFEPLFWMGIAWCVLRIIQTGNQKLWLLAGMLAGIGLENKHSMLIYGFGLIAGLALTRFRRSFTSLWFFAGLAFAFVLFLPNLFWNIHNHFPFLELQHNIRDDGRNVQLSALAFWGQEAVAMLPLSLPIWLAGAWYLFFDRDGQRYRALGWSCVISFGVINVMNPRVYYIWPAFPLLFAAGSVLWERWLRTPRWRLVRVVYPLLMIGLSALLAPTMLPVLPVQMYIRYAAAMHIEPPQIEHWKLGPLPQLYASQFGWEEMVVQVAGVYNSLPPERRLRTAIFAQNFGQAGAIDLFGKKYGLPDAISGHQNYFLWGPREYTGESVIVLQGQQEQLEKVYTSVERRAHVSHPFSMPREQGDIYYCTGLKWPLQKIWPSVKNWH
jgi:4-amino-4-deoxy-L-arabinose transferase-like glycosyltransferase